MKFFLLALFAATALAVPVPEEDDGGPVELIVNGVVEGEPLELGNVLGIHVNEHVDGVIASSTNLLHPLTAVGIAEATAAAEAAAAADDSFDVVIPQPVVLPPPVAPEVVFPEAIVPEPIILPSPVAPEVIIPEPVILPEPSLPEVVIPEPIILPSPEAPEVIVPKPVVLPEAPMPEVVISEDVDIPVAAGQIPNGEVFNNGVVQVSVNTPQEAGVFSTLQSWVSFVLNYFNDDVQTSHQII